MFTTEEDFTVLVVFRMDFVLHSIAPYSHALAEEPRIVGIFCNSINPLITPSHWTRQFKKTPRSELVFVTPPIGLEPMT